VANPLTIRFTIDDTTYEVAVRRPILKENTLELGPVVEKGFWSPDEWVLNTNIQPEWKTEHGNAAPE
jgi:hypothetical protein